MILKCFCSCPWHGAGHLVSVRSFSPKCVRFKTIQTNIKPHWVVSLIRKGPHLLHSCFFPSSYHVGWSLCVLGASLQGGGGPGTVGMDASCVHTPPRLGPLELLGQCPRHQLPWLCLCGRALLWTSCAALVVRRGSSWVPNSEISGAALTAPEPPEGSSEGSSVSRGTCSSACVLPTWTGEHLRGAAWAPDTRLGVVCFLPRACPAEQQAPRATETRGGLLTRQLSQG